MRIIATADGQPACYHCKRAFDNHPTTAERERLFSKIRAIEDDDYAARAFHYYTTQHAYSDSMTEQWTPHTTFDIPGVGTMSVDCIRLKLEPGAGPELMIQELDKWLLNEMRTSIVQTLCPIFAQNEECPVPPPRRYPVWCPDSPSVHELYPLGYIRHSDGTVEAKTEQH
jgi:hypothetical protein